MYHGHVVWHNRLLMNTVAVWTKVWIAVHDAMRLTAILVSPADLSKVDVKCVASRLQRMSNGGLEEGAARMCPQHNPVQHLGHVQRVRHIRYAAVHVRAAPELQQPVVVVEQIGADDVIEAELGALAAMR